MRLLHLADQPDVHGHGRDRQQHRDGGHRLRVDGGQQRSVDFGDGRRERPGPGTMSFSVAANTGAASRSGTLTIAGTTFDVTQAASCSISPTSQSFSSMAGTGSSTVTAGAGCAWTAATNRNWIAITSGATGSGHEMTPRRTA